MDDFCKDMVDDPLFIKMDIEGAEELVLKGANTIFDKCRKLTFAVCCYHGQNNPWFQVNYYLNKGCSATPQIGYRAHRIKSVVIRGHKK